MASIQNLIRKAETGAQWADVCKIEAEAVALIANYGFAANEITDILIADDGSLSSVALGVDDDGMARYILNFSI